MRGKRNILRTGKHYISHDNLHILWAHGYTERKEENCMFSIIERKLI